MTRVETLALDLEGTLISNAISQFPRPGLFEFLEFCRNTFPRVVTFTGVEERRFRKVACQLILEGAAPRWFGDVIHVYWRGEFKDLRIIPDATVDTCLLVDDLEDIIRPDQKARWIRIEPFERPYPSSDSELMRVQGVLKRYQE